MTAFPASEMLALFAALIAAAFAVVQAARTLRTGSVDGISPVSWLAMPANAGLWTVYGVTTGSGQQILANEPWVFITVIIGSYLATSRGLPAAVGVDVALLGVPLGVLLTLGVGIPQIAVLRRSVGAAGVSLIGWVLSTVAATCWFVYGVVESRPAVYLCSTLGFVINATVTVSLVGARRRGRMVSSVAEGCDGFAVRLPAGVAQ